MRDRGRPASETAPMLVTWGRAGVPLAQRKPRTQPTVLSFEASAPQPTVLSIERRLLRGPQF